MVARKKVEEIPAIDEELSCNNVEKQNVENQIVPQKIDELEGKYEALTIYMIDKAHDLLRAAGDGSGELKIKQIEKAIEIYKAIMAE